MKKLDIHRLLYEFIKSHKVLFLLYLISTIILYPINYVSIPSYYGNVINSFKDNKQAKFVSYVKWLLGAYVVSWALENFVLYLQYHIVPDFSEFATGKIFGFILDHYEMDFENIHTGEILSKIIRMPGILFEYVDVFRIEFLKEFFVLITAVYNYYQVSLPVALTYLVFVTVNYVYMYVMYNIFYKFNLKTNRIQDRMYEYLVDCFNNLATVYSFNQTQTEMDRFYDFSFKPYKGIMSDNLRVYLYGDMFWGLVTVSMFVVMNALVYRAYQNKLINAEKLISTFVISYSILRLYEKAEGSAQRLALVYSQIGDTEAFFNKVSSYNFNAHKNTASNKRFVNGNIVFRNVYHKYDPSGETFVLDNINLEIAKGEKVALVGQIGSGKSTLVKLLLGFQPIQMGTVTIGGVNVNDISNTELRENIFYIPQKPKLFNRTLYENVVYGLKTKPSREDVGRLLRDLSLDEIAQTFQEKMDVEVGVDGNALSGGQRQVVWLLRSFYRQSKILVLDEPTASLDPHNKESMVSVIKKLAAGKTVIIISHDHIDSMFRKVELKNGRLVQATFFD
jgi:ATP-binding cassette subfamily B multidrug efflux pump